MFVLQLLKSMRTACLKADSKSGLGQETFLSVADMALADYIGKQERLGIAKMLYKYFHNGQSGDGRVIVKKAEPLFQRPLQQPQTETREINDAPKLDLTISKDIVLETVEKAAQQYDLSPTLLKAMIKAESAGNSEAVSAKGAKGLMQLMDSTAQEMGVTDQFDPEQNIMGGAKYLRRLLDMFKGDLRLALAAYNAGPGNVLRFGGIPPFRETQDYVQRVIKFMADLDHNKDSKLLAEKD
jgi:soluble lytic murein transglycosylase-like protein